MEEHGSADTPSSLAPKRKHRTGFRRVQIACERCRTRKHKCDGRSPTCSTCEKAGTPCIVLDRLTYKQYPRGHVEALENEIDALKKRIDQLELEATQAHNDVQNTEAIEYADTIRSRPICDFDQALDSPNTNIGSTSLDATSDDRFVGESSGNYFGNVLQTVLLHSNYKHQQGPAHSRYRLRLSRKSTDTPAQVDFPEDFISLPGMDEAKRLCDAFFTHKWPSLPSQHKPSFLRKHFHPVLADPQSASPISLFLTFMVFALGAIDLRRLGDPSSKSHREYFNIAITRYLDGLIKADNTVTVQGLLLVGHYAINESQSVNAWHVAGQAVRVAVDLGLHRASTPGTYGLLEEEMRKRIFWSAYVLDRNVSVNLGRPPAIRDRDITVGMPLQLTDDELLLYSSLLIIPTPRAARHDDTFTLVYIIKVRRLQSKIQDIFYPADATLAAPDDIEFQRTSLRAELDEWIANVPRFSRPTTVTYQSEEWFHIVYSHSLLLLYRPSPASPTATLEALQVCADAAISLINSYSSLYAKNKVSYTWLALHGLFMASVTMLYTIWVSPQIRRSTNKAVVKTNVMSCLALFQVMRDFWPLAARCHEVIDRLGRASVALFDKAEESQAATGAVSQQRFGEINAEYMDWFDTKDNTPSQSGDITGANSGFTEIDAGLCDNALPSQSYSLDVNSNMDLFPDLDQLFQQGFDMNIPLMTNAFDQPFVSGD